MRNLSKKQSSDFWENMTAQLQKIFRKYQWTHVRLFPLGTIQYDVHESSPILKTPIPLSSYVQNSSTPLTLNVQQINKKQSNDGYYIWSGLSFRLAFVLSINSLILSGFPMTSFYLAKASLVLRSILKN